MDNATELMRAKLFELQDEAYRDFVARLMPTVDPARIIGIRTPDMIKLVQSVCKTPEAAKFVEILPHYYYEEYNLHGALISRIKDYNAAMSKIELWLPYVDNWATCDSVYPTVFGKNIDRLLPKIVEWTGSSHTYTVRYGVGMLMRYYLDEHFDPSYLELVASVESDEYYINMMRAWFYATALAKQCSDALPYFTEHRLDEWTRKKAIRKAIESRRISNELKTLLRGL